MKIKKGDEVLVITGKDKGRRGTVLAAYPQRNRVLVEGVNAVKRHTPMTPTARGGREGGIVTVESPIHVSNVVLLVEGTPTRVGYRVREDGVKVRVARSNGQDIDSPKNAGADKKDKK